MHFRNAIQNEQIERKHHSASFHRVHSAGWLMNRASEFGFWKKLPKLFRFAIRQRPTFSGVIFHEESFSGARKPRVNIARASTAFGSALSYIHIFFLIFISVLFSTGVSCDEKCRFYLWKNVRRAWWGLYKIWIARKSGWWPLCDVRLLRCDLTAMLVWNIDNTEMNKNSMYKI